MPNQLLTRIGLGLALAVGTLYPIACVPLGDDSPAEPVAQSTAKLTPTGPTLTLQPGAEGKDARVFSLAAGADVNYGAYHGLDALAWTWSGVPATTRSYIDFDLSALPGGSAVRRATLVLSANPNTAQPAGHSQLTGTNEWRLERVTQPWNETEITWNKQPATDPSDSVAVPASTSSDQTYEVDVTELIRKKLSDPSNNHGFVLRLQDERHYRALQFASSDHPTAELRPKLVIEHYNAARIAAGGSCDIDFTGNHRGLDANFTAFALAGTAPYTFTWDFGDGNTATGDSVSHTYDKAGKYEVCVEMADDSKDDAGAPCVAKKCGDVDVLSVTGACCDPNDKITVKDVEYEPGHFAKFEFRTTNVPQLGIYELVAEVTTTDANGKREEVDHLYVDIMATLHKLDTGKACGTDTWLTDGYDNASGDANLKLKLKQGQAFGVGAGEASAFFKVRRGQAVYTKEILLADCKADHDSCSRDTACASGKCGGCLDQSLGWCFTPASAPYGAECKADDECTTGRCSADCYLNPTGKCLCKENSDCQADEYCGWGFNSGKCIKKKADRDACSENDECQSGQCGGCLNLTGWCYTPNSKAYDQECRSDGECSTGRCSADCYANSRGKCLCNGPEDCQAGQFCGWGLNSGKCMWKKSDHQSCASGAECQSGHCAGIVNGLGWCFTPNSKQIGQGCRADNECVTNRCVDLTQLCGCTNDAQCGAGNFCNQTLGQCKSKKGKNALCSRDSECASGKCRAIRLCK